MNYELANWGDGMYQNDTLSKMFKFIGVVSGLSLVLWTSQNCSSDFRRSQYTKTDSSSNSPASISTAIDAELGTYVEEAHQKILDRTDVENAQDESGIAYWVSRLKAGLTKEEFEALLLVSTEYKIRQLYLEELHRRADFEGLKYWMNDVDSGRITIEALRLHFRDICTRHTEGECGGIAQPNPTPAETEVAAYKITPRGKFLLQLYSGILNMPQPDTEGFLYWKRSIESGSVSCRTLAKSFMFHSTIREQARRDENLRRTYIGAVYRGLFAREPDVAGLEHWLNILRSGQTIDQVEDYILGSDEFRYISCLNANIIY